MKFPAKIIQLPTYKVGHLIKWIDNEIEKYRNNDTIQLDREGGHIVYPGGCAAWALSRIKEGFEKTFLETTTSPVVLLESMKRTNRDDYKVVERNAGRLRYDRSRQPQDRDSNLDAFDMLDYNCFEGSLLLFRLLEKRGQEQNENIRKLLLYMIELCITYEKIKYSGNEQYKKCSPITSETGKLLNNQKIIDALYALGDDYQGIREMFQEHVEYDDQCFNAFYEIYTVVAKMLQQCGCASSFTSSHEDYQIKFLESIKKIIERNFSTEDSYYKRIDATDLLFLLIGSLLSLKHKNDQGLEYLLVKWAIIMLKDQYTLTFDLEKKYSATLELHSFSRFEWESTLIEYKDSSLKDIILKWLQGDDKEFLLEKLKSLFSDQKANKSGKAGNFEEEEPPKYPKNPSGFWGTDGQSFSGSGGFRTSTPTAPIGTWQKEDRLIFRDDIVFPSCYDSEKMSLAYEVLGLLPGRNPDESLGLMAKALKKSYHPDKGTAKYGKDNCDRACQNIDNALAYIVRFKEEKNRDHPEFCVNSRSH